MLTCHVLEDHHLEIRPAPLERDWMDATPQRFAYRCLPMNIANGHGWEILCERDFSASWNGTPAKDAITITPPGYATSHFGCGILTFHVPGIFRTDPGVDLYVTGPVNRPKDAIAPLTGVVETDWAPYTFTVNWMFTRAHHTIHFAKGEPICHLFPVDRGSLERMDPAIIPIRQNPELAEQYASWCQSRNDFNSKLEVPGSAAVEQRWQKTYFRGQGPDGSPAAAHDHRSRLHVKAFRSTR